MENKNLNRFAIAFGIAVFLVILLGVMHLFRFALLVFGISGFVFLIWGMFLANEDEELREMNEAKRAPKANTPLQKKLLKEIKQAKNEVLKRKKVIESLEEKSAYFIKKVYKEWLRGEKNARAIFLRYEEIKSKHSHEVAPHLSENCEKIIIQHRSEIELLSSEIYYWQIVGKKYSKAFDDIFTSQAQMNSLQEQLKKKEKKIEMEAELGREMQAYLDGKSDQEDGLGDAIYENMHFSEVKDEVNKQLADLEAAMKRTAEQINNLEEVTRSYHDLQKKELGTSGTTVEKSLAEEIRLLSKQLEEL